MNSDIFNFNRFGKYFTTDFKSFITRYWLSLLILSCSGVFIYIFKRILRIIFMGGDDFSGDYSFFGAPSRGVIFLIFLAITTITAPKKCYGYITDKKDGTSFLLLPASRLEKYLSMLIISCIILPLIFITMYLSIDTLICMLDSHCGDPIASLNLFDAIIKMNEGNIISFDDGSQVNILNLDVIKPWMFIDDIFSIVLFFLLGALIFKRSKIAKTLGCYLIISAVLGLILLPFYMGQINEMAEAANDSIIQVGTSPDIFEPQFNNFVKLLKKFMRYDLISDSITNICLQVGIWFRLKTINH